MSLEYMTINNPRYKYRLKRYPVFLKDEKCLQIIHDVIDEKWAIYSFSGNC